MNLQTEILEKGFSETGKLLGGDKLYILAPSTKVKSQMMGYVLKGENSIIVIDGGWRDDCFQLENLLVELGCRVDAWIITHAHPDHIGAIVPILKNRKIFIEEIYADIPNIYKDPVKYRVKTDEIEEFFDLCKTQNIDLKTDIPFEKIKIGDFKVLFFKDGKMLDEDFNNSSLVFKIFARDKSILFLGDVFPIACKMLVEKHGDLLKSDICQLAHHGQNGVDISFYEFIGFKYALWNAPIWLWNNDIGDGFDTGPFGTVNTRKQMEKLKVFNINAFDKTQIIE